MRYSAFIPARQGSKRVKDKNIRLLNGHPLIAHTISTALESEIFDEVYVWTDSEKYADIAMRYGASVPFLRKTGSSGDVSPDITWVIEAIEGLEKRGAVSDAFSILRPTCPFRTVKMLNSAIDKFTEFDAHSLRAVELVQQHPGKMWRVIGDQLTPILPYEIDSVPWHSSQYTALPEIYVQNASLEICWWNIPKQMNSISGHKIIPYFTEDYEGFDINYELDFKMAEQLIEEQVTLAPNFNFVSKK